MSSAVAVERRKNLGRMIAMSSLRMGFFSHAVASFRLSAPDNTVFCTQGKNDCVAQCHARNAGSLSECGQQGLSVEEPS